MTDATQQADQQQQDQQQTDQTLDKKGSADQTSTPNDAKATDKAADKAKATDKAADKGQQDEAPWYAGLPDDLKAEKSILRHASLEDAIRAAVGAEKRLGVPADQLVRLPSTDEERAALYTKLGAPATAEDYKIGLPDDATDEDKAAAKSFAEHMHKAGPFPPDFIKAAVDWNNQMAEAATAAMAEAETARKTAAEGLLKKELGAAYDPEMKAVGKLLNDLGGEELAKELAASGLGDNPRLVMALHKMVDRLGEPGELDGQGKAKAADALLTRGQAKAALHTLENDALKGKALRDKTHSMHKTVLAERTRLAKMAEGIDPDT